ncbi:MAG: hypothetical protein IJP52_01710 [Paludibacteraceae bacterium]|nr:hypothetical protein [Paludibacteraceae bacterium]
MKKVFLLLVAVSVGVLVWAEGPYNLVTRSSASFIPEGAINGKAVFSVSPTKQVFFSMGNLQFCANPSSEPTTHIVQGGETAPGVWRFAEHQYDYVGCNASPGNVTGSTNNSMSSTYSGWIDVFAWGTSGYLSSSESRNPVYYMPYHYTNPQDWTTERYGPDHNHQVDLTASNYDWGYYNAIENGGGDPGYWRVLSRDEWAYLLGITNSAHTSKRDGASSKWTIANVHGKRGIILLPDALSASILSSDYGISLTMSKYSSPFESVSNDNWAVMESLGVAFLPFCYERNYDLNFYDMPVYWSASSGGTGSWDPTMAAPSYVNAWAISVPSSNTPAVASYQRHQGCCVRLVYDIQ